MPSVGLVVLSPLLAVVWVLVRVRMGAPVLFRQERPGLDGEPFTLLKFRTMTDRRTADGAPLPDADRLTAFGHVPAPHEHRRVARAVERADG